MEKGAATMHSSNVTDVDAPIHFVKSLSLTWINYHVFVVKVKVDLILVEGASPYAGIDL